MLVRSGIKEMKIYCYQHFKDKLDCHPIEKERPLILRNMLEDKDERIRNYANIYKEEQEEQDEQRRTSRQIKTDSAFHKSEVRHIRDIE